jgi:outer membrane protein OmpA-like peptidoglycan-associated protein
MGFACNLGMRNRALWTLAFGAALLAGCATTPAPSVVQPGAQPSAATPSAPTAVSLAAEQRRLADLFAGTPVVWEMTPEGNLRVQVPLKFCFKKGQSAVEPPLAKVLDYVAPSAKSPGMKTRVLAPADNGKPGALVQERAASARDYLVGKGVPVTHFAGLGAAHGDSVEIVVGKQL